VIALEGGGYGHGAPLGRTSEQCYGEVLTRALV
jgi:hypothetical protein